MQPSAVTISAAHQQSPSDDVRSIGDDEKAAALKALGWSTDAT